MFADIAAIARLALNGATPVEPLLRPPAHSTLLDAQQVRVLIVGSAVINPNGPDNGPASVFFRRDGTFTSSANGVVPWIKHGRYQLRGSRVCVGQLCAAYARDSRGYLEGTPYRGRWIWIRVNVANQNS